ncbi:taste receptor type 2 member 14-like [Dipodomys spectabilis]|uniref:taste receptor type 2 member 14-like n=1 Tax=Dipodomys spectabilis TaxID=105255 RepID=UPI001C53F753|nr:taste receptor type 2 member 14-like [Dipodomys spectabilis]
MIFSVEFLVGNLGNGFVALVNGRDWLQGRKLSAVDQILTALSVSRIALLGLTFLNWWAALYCPSSLMTPSRLRAVYIPWTVLNHCSLWLATSLSIYYFLRIANFSNAFFLYLRFRVRRVVWCILLASLALLLVNIMLMNSHIDIWVRSSGTNASHTLSREFSKLLLAPNLAFSLLPFALSLVAGLLLLASLWQHWRCRGAVAGDKRAEAHRRALGSVAAFLLLYILFFLTFLLHVWTLEFPQKNLTNLFYEVTAAVFPTGHSIVLILGTRKLWGVALSALRGAAGSCRGVRRPPHP